ncbi:hypothetical protein [Empedobacter sedimenti]|uniref:hypothetical protein n=1 Tax=Empedobacter sedimenti TaxID=3042610 RepID=UPI0024A74FA1|nr:hypothetical protein [Empedobacter sedimenti]
MKIKFLALVNVVFTTILYAQVGIGTSNPNATLDVSIDANYKSGDKAGVAFPMMSGNQIEAMSTTNLKAGTLVYANAISTNSMPDVDALGLWYWTGDAAKKWEPLNLGYKKVVSYFYAPSIALPTDIAGVSTDSSSTIWYDSATSMFNVKLFEIYKSQFDLSGNVSGANKSALKSPSATTIPVLNKTDLEYFVTYFDNQVFDPSKITLDDNGVLKYSILSNPMVTENTFMNIVFKVK